MQTTKKRFQDYTQTQNIYIKTGVHTSKRSKTAETEAKKVKMDTIWAEISSKLCISKVEEERRKITNKKLVIAASQKSLGVLVINKGRQMQEEEEDEDTVFAYISLC